MDELRTFALTRDIKNTNGLSLSQWQFLPIQKIEVRILALKIECGLSTAAICPDLEDKSASVM